MADDILTDITKRIPADASAFGEQLRASPFLSHCFGPYPPEWKVKTIAWPQAMDAAESLLGNEHSWTNIDKARIDAARHADRLASGRGVMGAIVWSLGLSGMKREFDRIETDVSKIISRKAYDWQGLSRGDSVVIEDYLWCILSTAAELIAVGCSRDHPIFMRVVELTMQGFLPVDFTEDRGEVTFVFPNPPEVKQSP